MYKKQVNNKCYDRKTFDEPIVRSECFTQSVTFRSLADNFNRV